MPQELTDGAEDVVLVNTELARLLQIVGEDVEEELRVAVGVDVPVRVVVEVVAEMGRIDEVAILVWALAFVRSISKRESGGSM